MIVVLIANVAYFFIKQSHVTSNNSFQLDVVSQKQIDSLKGVIKNSDTIKIFPFNPNFITDFKGYTLGMSTEEIDRLHQFRSKDQYVNSSKEFQTVTKISDSLLQAISPYFKFPDWTKKQVREKEVFSERSKVKPNTTFKDLNTATVEELKGINGIGEKLSARIVKFRNRLGGFLVNEQLYDVYGLEPEVVERALKVFRVTDPPRIEKININTASTERIASLVYIPYNVAERIVAYRNIHGPFKQLSDLSAIEGYSKDKSARIELYLTF